MNNALTDVRGILVGHWSDPEHGTGCTVVLTPEGSCCGVDVRGSAPGTRETALLDPVNRVDRVHGVLLSGAPHTGWARRTASLSGWQIGTTAGTHRPHRFRLCLPRSSTTWGWEVRQNTLPRRTPSQPARRPPLRTRARFSRSRSRLHCGKTVRIRSMYAGRAGPGLCNIAWRRCRFGIGRSQRGWRRRGPDEGSTGGGGTRFGKRRTGRQPCRSRRLRGLGFSSDRPTQTPPRLRIRMTNRRRKALARSRTTRQLVLSPQISVFPSRQ